jgi:hypothetical protein
MVITVEVSLEYTVFVPPLLDGSFQRWIINPVCCCHRAEYACSY